MAGTKERLLHCQVSFLDRGTNVSLTSSAAKSPSLTWELGIASTSFPVKSPSLTWELDRGKVPPKDLWDELQEKKEECFGASVLGGGSVFLGALGALDCSTCSELIGRFGTLGRVLRLCLLHYPEHQAAMTASNTDLVLEGWVLHSIATGVLHNLNGLCPPRCPSLGSRYT